MTPIQVVNRTRGTVLGGQVRIADRVWSRARGLLFSARLEPGEGLLLSPCQGVHMFGMCFALDVVFLNEAGEVVAAHPDLRPWRWTPFHRHAAHALELPVGTLTVTRTEIGDELSWGSATGEPSRSRDVTNDRHTSWRRKKRMA